MQNQEVDEFLEFARSLRGDSAGEQASWSLHDEMGGLRQPLPACTELGGLWSRLADGHSTCEHCSGPGTCTPLAAGTGTVNNAPCWPYLYIILHRA